MTPHLGVKKMNTDVKKNVKKKRFRRSLTRREIRKIDEELSKTRESSVLFRDRTVRPTYKICLIGDPAVGKSTLRQRFMGETPTKDYIMTVGADFAVKHLRIEEKQVILQIWDLAGQQVFNQILPSYYAGAKGALAVFDLTRPDTLRTIPSWVRGFWKSTSTAVPVILIGNKIDLKDKITVNKDQVKEIENTLKEMASSEIFQPKTIYTSALHGQNVDLAFEVLVKTIIIYIEKKISGNNEN